MKRLLPVAVVLASTPLLMAERCGPAVSLQPAYVKGAVVADDTLVGDYVVMTGDEKKKLGSETASIVRDNTEDGPSYLLTIKGTKEFADSQMRLFVFDVGGVRFADLVAMDRTKTGTFAKGLALPAHLLLKVVRPAGGGLTLLFLNAEWVDIEVAKDPKGIPTLALPRNYKKDMDGTLSSERAPALSGDAASLQKLLGRAAADPKAWGLGLELAKKGGPLLRFSLTWEDAEISRDASSQKETWQVLGSLVELQSERSGRQVGPPMDDTSKRTGTVNDPAALDALVKAFKKTAPAKPKTPVPKVDTHIVRVCLDEVAGSKPRCVERVKADESGADRAAILAIRDHLFTTLSPVAPPASAPAAPAAPPKKP